MRRFPLRFSTMFSFLFLLLLSPSFSPAQDKINKLNVNAQLNFFSSKLSQTGASFGTLNPGVEALYEWDLAKNISFLTGADYIYSARIHPIGFNGEFKDLAHEVFIPILFNAEVIQRVDLTWGIYPGWLVKGKELYKDVSTIRDWIDVTDKFTDYSSSRKFTADLFLGAGYTPFIQNKKFIQFEPFIKYKVKDNWMKKFRNQVSFGIKINYLIEI